MPYADNHLRRRETGAAESPIGLAVGLLLVGVAIFAGQLALPAWGTPATVLLFLPAVLVTARFSGFASAIIVSVIATLSFDYFLTEPYHSLRIDSPVDIVTAIVFFLVALTISHLADAIRAEARLAAERASDQAVVADFARQLITCADRKSVAETAVSHFARLFDCQTLYAIEGDRPEIICSEPAMVTLAPNEEAALVTTLALGKPSGRRFQRVSQAEWQFNPVMGGSKIRGAIGLARSDGGPPVPENRRELLESLLDQVALAVERAQREAEAQAVIVSREQERFRAGLRASISEDIRPRIHAIQSGVKRIRRNVGDKEAARAVVSETEKLQQCVDHLGDLGSVADLEPIICGQLQIDLFRHQVTREGHVVRLTPKEFAVLSELARNAGRVLTHRQLRRSVWGPAHEKHIDYLRVVIRALRQKLEVDATRLRTHCGSQKMTVAAMQMADMKVWAQRS